MYEIIGPVLFICAFVALLIAIGKSVVLQSAILAAIAGALLAEFTGIGGGLCMIAQPFSPARNEAAIAFGVAGFLIGAVLGEIGRRSRDDRRPTFKPSRPSLPPMWRVYGANRKTGEDSQALIHAADEQEAAEAANDLGILVERIERE